MLHLVICTSFNSSSLTPLLFLHVFILFLYVMLRLFFFIGVLFIVCRIHLLFV